MPVVGHINQQLRRHTTRRGLALNPVVKHADKGLRVEGLVEEELEVEVLEVHGERRQERRAGKGGSAGRVKGKGDREQRRKVLLFTVYCLPAYLFPL